MTKNRVDPNNYDLIMQKGITCLSSKKLQKVYHASNLFSKAFKKAKNDDERARALQMLGKTQYCLKQYTQSEKSLKCALEKATDNILIDSICFDIAMVTLHVSGKIWVMHDKSMSWIFSATRAKRWKYIFKSIILSIRTKSISNFKDTFKMISFILSTNR